MWSQMPSDIGSNISNWQLVTLLTVLAIRFSFNICSFGTLSIQSPCEIDFCILVTRPDLTVTPARNDKDLVTVLYKCLELSPSAPPLQRSAKPCGLLKRGSRIFHDWIFVGTLPTCLIHQILFCRVCHHSTLSHYFACIPATSGLVGV